MKKSLLKSGVGFILTLFLMGLLNLPVYAAPPNLINYQGSLTDSGGTPVPDGTHTMVFRIFDTDTGGTALYAESHPAVAVTGGIYNVLIGSGTPSVSSPTFDPALFSGGSCWLEVQVDGEILTPRQRIVSVAYSLHAGDADTLAGQPPAAYDQSVHAARTDNPHGVTAAQAGADPAGAAAAVQTNLDTHAADPSAHHARYTDGEAVTAMGTTGPTNPLNHAKTTSFTELTDQISDSQIPASITRDAEITALQAQVSILQASVSALQDLLQHVTRSGNNIFITGANLHIVSGSGATDGLVNGLGNLIVGYNELRNNGTDDRTGSHNIVVGSRQNFSSYGGLVAGYYNTVSGAYASVSGGVSNTASHNYASVSGGSGNTAAGISASVSGGQNNTANYDYASVSGGEYNTASGISASVSGGHYNNASAYSASVSGGAFNTAGGNYASVSGGYINTASGNSASVSGGASNTASYDSASVSGGESNTAGGNSASVSGGYYNTAGVYYASVSGGEHNTAGGTAASVSGGNGNTASGTAASVSGGNGNTASYYYASVSGGSGNTAASGTATSVAGGRNNMAGGDYTSVAGGRNNVASGVYASVSGGGGPNVVDGNIAVADYSAILGGLNNVAGYGICAWDATAGRTICTVSTNHTTGQQSTVSGGTTNTASGNSASVSGGENNTAGGNSASVSGGSNNTANVYSASVSGGTGNFAGWSNASIPGTRNTYSVTAMYNTTPQTVSMGLHGFCALTTVSTTAGDNGTNRWCQVTRNADDTWTLNARTGTGQTTSCEAICY